MLGNPDNLPISETLAVFLGVSGFEWLSEGQAGLLNAMLTALISGFFVYVFRRHFRQNDNNTK
ncbi:hypothetical protein [Azonexus sp.]|uniref:hypothetical protein n=1 Tax=Azonexus sp. TaxID=1872668 RepID=UPI0027BA3277|nr:hypothetical protein [Azonexus sp.]